MLTSQTIPRRHSRGTELPSWAESTSRRAIVDFVVRVTDDHDRDFVPANERIAVFDNDGTLWPEQPVPIQLLFAADDAKRRAAVDPALAGREPFQSLLAGDLKAIAAQGTKAVAEVVRVTHTGMTTDEYADAVRAWFKTATHPKLGRPVTQLVYQPMLELLDYLRANGFATFIVSGGGADFMRVFADEVYGIPRHQVIGTTFKTHFEMHDGVPKLVIDPEVDLFDDKAAKPAAIHKYIGRRPLACFGNSDGDREMLMATTLGRPDGREGFGLIVHHTDAEREFAYDRQHVPSGQLDKVLDEASEYGWVLADMKHDWTTVFPN